VLPQHLHAHCTLAGYNIRIIEWMHKYQPFFLNQRHGMLKGIIIGVAMEYGTSPQAANCLHLDRRSGLRHDDQ